MLPNRVSNPGPLTYESGALPIALRGLATLLEALAVGTKQYTLKSENVKKCIRMGITILRIVICGGKLSFLWL